MGTMLTRSSVLRLAVLGVGHWGSNLARNFAALNVLSATSDIRTDRSSHTERNLDVPAVSFPALLNDPAIGAIAIATPSQFHYSQARAALLAGKHVFVEKPIAFRLSEAEELVELAQMRGRVLMTGHVARFHPAVQRALELVQSGAIGTLRHVSTQRLAASANRNRDSALWDLAPHDISIVLALAGQEPEWIESFGAMQVPGSGDGIAHIYMGFVGGLSAHVHVSKVHPFKEVRLVLTGTRGALVFEVSESQPLGSLVLTQAEPDRNGTGVGSAVARRSVAFGQEEPLRLECQEFIESIVHNRVPLTDGHEALGVLKVVLAASNSCRSAHAGAPRAELESAMDQPTDAIAPAMPF